MTPRSSNGSFLVQPVVLTFLKKYATLILNSSAWTVWCGIILKKGISVCVYAPGKRVMVIENTASGLRHEIILYKTLPFRWVWGNFCIPALCIIKQKPSFLVEKPLKKSRTRIANDRPRRRFGHPRWGIGVPSCAHERGKKTIQIQTKPTEGKTNI